MCVHACARESIEACLEIRQSVPVLCFLPIVELISFLNTEHDKKHMVMTG